MNGIPATSTTLLKDIGSSVTNARWGEFVSRYRPMMLAYLKAHFPAIDADDVVQETLAWDNLVKRVKKSLVAILEDDISGNEEQYRNGIVTSNGILVRRPKWNFEAKPVVEAA